MRATLAGRLNRWMRGDRRLESTRARADSPHARGGAASDDDLVVPRLGAEPWYVDKVTIDGSRLSAAGWSMPVAVQPPADGWFTVNGRRFDRIAYPLPRADVGAVFWQRKGSSLCGFECAIDDLPQAYPNGVLEIRRVVADTPRIARGRDSWFAPDPARQTSLPDEDRRFRVIGDRDPLGFLVSGTTDYHRMDRALVEVAGKRLHDFAHVLDWGVGCGRIARHFPADRAGALTGCDIDRDNVDWCADNLRGTFVSSRLAPPLPFRPGTFDLVYGVSVFTHLREPMQLRWLEELARVTQRDAILLMTTHGETAIDFSRLPPAGYRRIREQVRREGIVVSGTNTQLDGHAEHGGEYVNVYHDAEYVRQTWGRYFDVLHILPGYILHHDLVVLRRA